jgi:hypothetical protein
LASSSLSLGGSSFSGCRGAQFKGEQRKIAQSAKQPLTLFTDGIWEIYWNGGDLKPEEQSQLISTAVSRLQSFRQALSPLSKAAHGKIQGLRYRVTFLKEIEGGRKSFFFPSETSPRVVEIHLLASEAREEAGALAFMREAFHAIQWAVHPGERSWIKEGLNFYFALDFVEKNYSAVSHLGLSDFTTALTEDADQAGLSESEVEARIGHSYQYVSYLVFQCGDSWFWRAIEQGFEPSFNSKADKPQCRNFHTSAFAFEVARIHNRSAVGGKNPDLYSLGVESPRNLKPLGKFPHNLDLAKFETYLPLYFLGAVDLPLFTRLQALSLKRVWIEKAAPYSVKIRDSVPGRNPSRWDQILIRVSAEPEL